MTAYTDLYNDLQSKGDGQTILFSGIIYNTPYPY
jgi:hypothetical protein